jgi:hypothetical protein
MITSRSDFERVTQAIDRLVDRSTTLPDQVFRRRASAFHVIDFDQVWSEDFFREAQRRTTRAGDLSFTFAVLRPDPDNYYYAQFGKFPLLRFTELDTVQRFIDEVQEDPGDSPADAIAYNSGAILVYPASERWASYGDRDVEIGVVAAMDNEMEAAISTAGQSLRLFTQIEAVTQLLPPVYRGIVPEEVKRSLVLTTALEENRRVGPSVFTCSPTHPRRCHGVCNAREKQSATHGRREGVPPEFLEIVDPFCFFP